MGAFLFLSVVIASMAFFLNFVLLLRKLMTGEDGIEYPTFIGTILIGYITYVSIMLMSM